MGFYKTVKMYVCDIFNLNSYGCQLYTAGEGSAIRERCVLKMVERGSNA